MNIMRPHMHAHAHTEAGRDLWQILVCLFSLFNNTFIISDYTVSNERMIMNNELEKMWMEGV